MKVATATQFNSDKFLFIKVLNDQRSSDTTAMMRTQETSGTMLKADERVAASSVNDIVLTVDGAPGICNLA